MTPVVSNAPRRCRLYHGASPGDETSYATQRLLFLRRGQVFARLAHAVSLHALLLLDLPQDRGWRWLRHQHHGRDGNAQGTRLEEYRGLPRAYYRGGREASDAVERSPPLLRKMRQRVQLIFQDSATAMNPRLTATEIIAEPLEVLRRGTRRERREVALQLMEEVGLSSQWGNRLPREFSGGERQRLAIARAIASQPKVLILDEPLCALDLPRRSEILRLLMKVKERRGLTCIFISHDMGMVCRVAREIAVLHQGRLVEQGSPKELILAPRHPHTRALVAASLTTEPWLAVS